MAYQDIWCNGWLLKQGTRECACRYDVIKQFCLDKKFQHCFSVLDIGANMCYFGLRLNSDFGCKVLAFEYHAPKMRQAHLDTSRCYDIVLISRKLSLNDLVTLKHFSKFDLVLALSVLHHVKGDKIEWLEAMLNIGDNVIVEYALEDSKRKNYISEYRDYVFKTGNVLGYGESHLNKEIRRPIIQITKEGIENAKRV